MIKQNGRRRFLAVGALLLIACLGSESVWSDDCEVRIGAAGPMTGGAASWGLALKDGAEFQAAVANEAGGLQLGSRKCKVKVVSYDAVQCGRRCRSVELLCEREGRCGNGARLLVGIDRIPTGCKA
ncbi:hypothetical protein [Burkholderia diffusa]|uniref:hypothetical protein n=1 Tax=Burkholderia diffusa TaxID=488732 RepID=UPI001FC8C664|nr:hypothetical protein [Burkholderia diffusa]